MLGRTTEWTASQVTELQTALAKLGYNIPQIRNMQASVLQFATAVGAKLPDAANLAGASLRMFGLHSTEMQKTLEVLTASTNKTALDFEKLKVSLPYVGAIANSIGFDVADTSALLGVLANSGLAASRTGTGLRKVLLELSKENGKLQTAMGGNIKTFDDFVNGLQGLRDRGLEAGEAQKLVGDRAGAALLILANGVDDIRRLNKEVRETDGLLKDIQAERLDTLHGSTLLLKSAWEGLIQTFRDSAGPMKDIVDWLTKIVRATSLAASRANRVAQGTKDIIGSDDLTKQFKQQYDSLLRAGHTPEAAAAIVQDAMNSWLQGAYGDLSALQKKGYKESVWNRFLLSNPLTGWAVQGKMRKGRAANEQVEAMENAMDAVTDYMANSAKEEGEIAANNYLEEWKMVFDTQGEQAAREAMSKITGYDDIKSRMEAYIANGGESGASGRGKGSGSGTPKLTTEEKAWIAMMEETEDWLERDFLKQLEQNTKALEKQLDARDKAATDYEQFYKDWSGTDFGKHGNGAMFKITTAITDYKNKDQDADQKYAKGLALIQQAHKGNAAMIEKEAAKLRELRDLQKEMNRTEFTENVRGMAKDLYDEGMFGYDMTNWSDKSLSQILEIRDALSSLDVPDDVKKELEGYSEVLSVLIAELQKLAQKTVEKTVDPERWKKIAKQAKYIAERFLSVSNALKEYADATGNSSLSYGAEVVGRVSENLKAAEEGYKAWGGWWGAIIGGGSNLIEQILDAVTETEKEANALKEALRSIATDTAIKQFAENIKKAGESIWGENSLGEMQEAVAGLRELEKEIAKMSGIMHGGEIRPAILSTQGNYTGVEFTRKKETWFDLADRWSLEKIAAETGMKILDDYGNFNIELLNWVKQAGWDLTQEELDWIDEAIRISTNYAEAMKVVEKTAESILNGAVSDVADKIVDSWWEAGRAALDYADILEDVAKGYANLIVQDMLMDAAFDGEREQAFINALKNGDAETAMATVAGAMQAAQDMLPTIEQALQVFEPYRNMGGGSDSSLGTGIKGITEETAGLLASYINAIRADVSYIRVMQEKGWEHINAFGVSLPTLNDHIAQIAANTYDAAQRTESILSELRSVIGAPGTSGMVVRVENY
jgi:TP901 family phage tail tape measure protein